MKVKLIACVALLSMGSQAVKAAPDEVEAQQLILNLYHDYAWVAVIGGQWKGNEISSEEKSTLENFFDPHIASLIDKDNKCRSKGEVCNLDFDPIYASQDPAIYDLKVGRVNKNKVKVTFKYPETHEVISIDYSVVKLGSGWRINDVCYSDGSCLSRILEGSAK
ncbi:hypothetical protein [Xanthomonas bundabergensis]|uniref:hypothetical protein n=1 Tax=Xanthomonas bundabergensis TaxID=3160842 RepID=UPI003518E8E5